MCQTGFLKTGDKLPSEPLFGCADSRVERRRGQAGLRGEFGECAPEVVTLNEEVSGVVIKVRLKCLLEEHLPFEALDRDIRARNPIRSDALALEQTLCTFVQLVMWATAQAFDERLQVLADFVREQSLEVTTLQASERLRVQNRLEITHEDLVHDLGHRRRDMLKAVLPNDLPYEELKALHTSFEQSIPLAAAT
ncbi:MAG: hypothetical protein RLY21_1419 [Planctomycetota bacterium]|jgi:hypothetical protein